MNNLVSRLLCWLSLVSVLIAMPALAELTPEEQAAKERGIVLYHQYKAISAEPYLTIAAKAGDAESQFFLAEALRKNNRYMTKEAYQWLEAAAEQGHSYAMIRLGRSGDGLCAAINSCMGSAEESQHWLGRSNALNESKARQGDPEAMYLLYEVTLDEEWLEKAAEAGHAISQYWLAGFIKDGKGFYLWPGSREEAVEKWYKASAEGGYPLSMAKYALIRLNKGDDEGYRRWTKTAAETGYAEAVYNYGAGMAVMPDEYGYEKDLVSGYGLLSLLLELDGGGYANKELVETELPAIAEQMTPAQLEQAKAFAEEWKATHPPLSFYQQKLHPLDNLF